MRHRHARVERGKRAAEGGRRIALHDGKSGLHLIEHWLQRGEHPRGRLRQRLSRLHQIQVDVGNDGEGAQHLIEHGPMLRGDADGYCKFVGRLTKPPDKRAKLNRFGPRPKKE
jgi:hypothetical protein